MNKLIKLMLLAILTASVSAFAAGTVSVGYREKDIEFGKVSDSQGAVVVASDVDWKSFSFGVAAESHMTMNSTDLYKTSLTAGYKFVSTLADIKFGTQYRIANSPSKQDFAGHYRPFVTVSKGPLAVTARLDLESKLSNIEGSYSNVTNVTKNVDIKTSVFAGYTDANDALPKSVKEIKYTNAYYGASVDASWKMLSIGVIALQDGQLDKRNFGWRASVNRSF
jgi:hypothetical protein